MPLNSVLPPLTLPKDSNQSHGESSIEWNEKTTQQQLNEGNEWLAVVEGRKPPKAPYLRDRLKKKPKVHYV